MTSEAVGRDMKIDNAAAVPQSWLAFDARSFGSAEPHPVCSFEIAFAIGFGAVVELGSRTKHHLRTETRSITALKATTNHASYKAPG